MNKIKTYEEFLNESLDNEAVNNLIHAILDKRTDGEYYKFNEPNRTSWMIPNFDKPGYDDCIFKNPGGEFDFKGKYFVDKNAEYSAPLTPDVYYKAIEKIHNMGYVIGLRTENHHFFDRTGTVNYTTEFHYLMPAVYLRFYRKDSYGSIVKIFDETEFTNDIVNFDQNKYKNACGYIRRDVLPSDIQSQIKVWTVGMHDMKAKDSERLDWKEYDFPKTDIFTKKTIQYAQVSLGLHNKVYIDYDNRESIPLDITKLNFNIK